MSDDPYIWVRHWERFQHYSDRNPRWIKNYLEVLSSDDYLDLSLARRGILHGLWLEFAAGRRRLRVNTATLSRRLNGRVTVADLKALNDAGFLLFVDSKSLARCERAYSKAIASRAPARSREPEPEKEAGTKPSNRSERPPTPKPSTNGTLDVHSELLLAELLAWIGNDADERTAAVVRHALSESTESARTELETSISTARPRHRARYVVGTLKAATKRGKSSPDDDIDFG